MKLLIGVLHTQNLSSAAQILISCAMVQKRMRVLQPVQKMSICLLQNAVTEFYSNEIGPAGGLLALLWGCILFDLYCFHTFFKVSFLPYSLSHCFSCTNEKIWEPSGGQNNICKSHSALTTSAWSSDKIKFCWSCIINMFDHLLPSLLSMYICTYSICHYLCYTKCPVFILIT